jgi:pimeloyl-ACP methyl ester carboxylesterase
MSTVTEVNGLRPEPKKNAGKKEIKILMLHGFTQSGTLFRAKTRAVEKLLAKVLAPISLLPVLIYPTAPNRLLASDLPGYEPPADGAEDENDQPDTWAWFRKDEASGNYRLLDEGMATIATAIREAGGVDGVCGFSQGGCMTGLVAAALEPDRSLPEGPEGDWARGLRDANDGRPARFAVSYSGFFAPVPALSWCYEPKITTPTLHYIGSLDTVVEESRSQALVDMCQEPAVITHPGGHYVPMSKEWVMPLAGFIKQCAEESKMDARI